MAEGEGVELATAFISVIPSFRGVGAGLGAGFQAEGAKASQKFSSGFKSKFKLPTTKSLLGPALIAGAVVGLGKLGSSFHKAFATIRVDTGATGSKLTGLESDFKNLLSIRPDSMEDVGIAISSLNKRLGLTGPTLVKSGQQFLRLSSITKTDLATNIKAAGELFNSFGIKAAQQGPKLDELFRASQLTGVSVADLATGLTKTGPIFRTIGFSFEQSAGFLGVLGKAGVDASSVMPALSKSIATAAKEGKTASQVFAETFDAIKAAPNSTKAAEVAIGTFGARAGPRLAALIREGKVSFEGLTKSIANGKDTIAAAAVDTATFSGKFKTFKNQLAVKFEPVATRFFDQLTKSMADSGPLLDKVASALGLVADNANVIVPAVLALAGAFVVVKVAMTAARAATALWRIATVALNVVTTVATALQTAFNAVLALNPIALIVIAIIAVGVAVFVAYKKFKPFRDIVDKTGRFIKGTAIAAFALFRDHIKQIGIAFAISIAPILLVVAGVFLLVKAFQAASGSRVFKTFTTNLKASFQIVVTVIKLVVTEVSGAIRIISALIHGDWGKAWAIFKDTVAKVAVLVGQILGKLLALIGRSLITLGATILTLGRRAWSFLVQAAKAQITNLIVLVTQLPGKIAGLLAGLGRTLFTVGSSAFTNLKNAAFERIFGKGGLVDTIKAIPSTIKSLLAALPGELIQVGKSIIGGLISGIKGGTGNLGNAVKEIARKVIRSTKGPLHVSSPSRVMIAIGNDVAAGLALGISGGGAVAIREAQRLAASVGSVSSTTALGSHRVAIGGTARGRGAAGVTVNGDMHLHDGVDVDLLSRKLAFANSSGGF